MDRKKNTTSPYPAEFRERAVQMVIDHLDSYASLTAAVRDIAGKLGCSPDSLRVWYKQARRDAGKEAGPTSAERARIRELEREMRELRQANEILKKGEPMERQWSERHWRTHILPRRSSTARSANDCVH